MTYSSFRDVTVAVSSAAARQLSACALDGQQVLGQPVMESMRFLCIES